MELLPLVCFCLLTCSGTTFGVEEPPVTKMRVKEDENVILPCSLDSTNIQSDTFDWKKDEQKNVFMYSSGSHYNNGRSGQDPQFTGRVFHFEDQLQSGVASIVIRNTKVTDSGNYTCIFPFHQQRSIIELIVGAAPEPYVRPVNQANGRVLLQCLVEGAFPKPKVVWKDGAGNILPAKEPEVTENKGRYNINLKATVTKTDNYRCVSTEEEISHEVSTEIYVPVHGGSFPGAASKPVITLHPVNEGVLLQCEVRGAFPKPKVVWKDSAGNILPAKEPEVTVYKGVYNIILKTTVTKTDTYRCVSTQEEISHEVYTEIYVPVDGAAPKPVITLHPTNGGVLLQCEVRGVSPKPKVVWKDRAGNILPAKEPEVTKNEGRYNIILNTTVTETDYYRCVSTQEGSHEVYTETYVPVHEPQGPNTGLIVAGVGVGVGGVILGIIVASYSTSVRARATSCLNRVCSFLCRCFSREGSQAATSNNSERCKGDRAAMSDINLLEDDNDPNGGLSSGPQAETITNSDPDKQRLNEQSTSAV